MRIIVAGSRTITEADVVDAAIQAAVDANGWEVTEIVSGGARGVDRIGEQLARKHGLPVRVFPADWQQHGKAAGPIRNQQMADYADALVAVWDGESRGTADMVRRMKAAGKPVFVERVGT